MAEKYIYPNLNRDDTDDEQVPIEFPPSLDVLRPAQVLPPGNPNDSADDSTEDNSPRNFYSEERPPSEPTSSSELTPNTVETHGSRAEAGMVSLQEEDSASCLYDTARTTGAMQEASQCASSSICISAGNQIVELQQHPSYDRHPPPRVAIQPVTRFPPYPPIPVQAAHYQPEPLMEGMSHPQQEESRYGTQECVPSGACFDKTKQRFSERQMP